MKSFSFLLILTMSQAYAKLPSTEFCDNYPQEQKRIAQVKKNGWIQKNDEQAQSYLYGCLDLKWRDQLYKNLCLSKEIEITLPKAIFFYFDGFGYFKPREIKSLLNAVNVTGDEPAGMIPNGLRALDNYSRKIKEDRSINWYSDVQFHYHSGSGTDQIQGIENATVCYSSIIKDLSIIEENYPELKIPKKIVMGHSNGGINAINFANHFSTNENSYIDLLVTIDPVPKTGKFIVNKLLSKDSTQKIQKKENIGKAINFYQKSNDKVLAGLSTIQGVQIQGADLEYEINANHVNILMDKTVTDTIAQEVLDILKK